MSESSVYITAELSEINDTVLNARIFTKMRAAALLKISGMAIFHESILPEVVSIPACNSYTVMRVVVVGEVF